MPLFAKFRNDPTGRKYKVEKPNVSNLYQIMPYLFKISIIFALISSAYVKGQTGSESIRELTPIEADAMIESRWSR